MDFSAWWQACLGEGLSPDIVALNFNLYETEDEHRFDVQLVGSTFYDAADDDWACDCTYSSGETLYSFAAADWEQALKLFILAIKQHIGREEVKKKLGQIQYISAGFVDGDLIPVFTAEMGLLP